MQVLTELEGVEEVLTREETAERYLLDPDRIGDLAVFADRNTVFGVLDAEMESDSLPDTYRSHGSLYEREVPLIRWGSSFNDRPSHAAANWELLAGLGAGVFEDRVGARDDGSLQGVERR